MFKIKSLGVFCGSADGKNPRYVKDALKLGKILAENDIRLIYGAGHVGMMGAVAKGALDAGGTVVGIINTLAAVFGILNAQGIIARRRTAVHRCIRVCSDNSGNPREL